MTMRFRAPYVETVKERWHRIGLENAIKHRARSRYRIQINLHGNGRDADPRKPPIWPKCSLPFLFNTKDEAWAYMNDINPLKFFPEARSASVELEMLPIPISRRQ